MPSIPRCGVDRPSRSALGHRIPAQLEDYVARLKSKKTPLVLRVKGRAELVVQSAGSYQALLDRLERAEALAAIRQGVAPFQRGEGIPLEQAEEKLRAKHGFSR